MLAILWQIDKLEILLLFQHRIRVDVRHDLFFLELGWVDIVADFSLFVDGRLDLLIVFDDAIIFIASAAEHPSLHLQGGSIA